MIKSAGACEDNEMKKLKVYEVDYPPISRTIFLIKKKLTDKKISYSNMPHL